MKKYLLAAICFLFLSSNAHALDLSRVKTWAASEILTAADLNGEFNNILNHSLTNNDINAAAGIVGSKLDLSSPGVIGATTAYAATFTTLTINSTSIFKDKMSFTQTDNLEYIDSLADGYLDFEATTGLRWRINATEQVNLTDGLLAPTTDDDIDLGSTTKEFKDLWIDGTANIDSLVADTADINGGTMDLVQIGGTTATGELIVNDASDDADGLGSQGTSGQYLESAGAGANPVWANNSRVNVLFSYVGQDSASTNYGKYNSGTSTAPTTSFFNEYFSNKVAGSSTYSNIVPTFKWIKVAGVNTWTILIKAWDGNTTTSFDSFNLKVVVGSVSGTLTSLTGTTPAWRAAFTVDVSGLVNGTTYDIDIQGSYTEAGGGGAEFIHISAYDIFGS